MPGLPTTTTTTTQTHTFLIWGGNGWVAGHLKTLLDETQTRSSVYTTSVRMEDRAAVEAVLDTIRPTHVFNCAGKTGRPNVDWCEDHKMETVKANVDGMINLMDCCVRSGVHVTVFATGCVYEYDRDHPEGGRGFVETEEANFRGSFYSRTKALAEEVMKSEPGVLILRLRMPVSDDLHPRSFVTKITNYDRVVNVQNSNSILHDLLPAAILLASHNESGVYNFTNPGAISHNEVLALYQKLVNPGFKWRNFSLEEQGKILKAGRSNCKLDTTKLEEKLREYAYVVPEVHEAYEACFRRLVANREGAGKREGKKRTRAVDKGEEGREKKIRAVAVGASQIVGI